MPGPAEHPAADAPPVRRRGVAARLGTILRGWFLASPNDSAASSWIVPGDISAWPVVHVRLGQERDQVDSRIPQMGRSVPPDRLKDGAA